MNTENLIAQNLLQIKAIKLNLQNPFTWASGIRSPIYCDNRITLSYPQVRDLIKTSFADLVNSMGTFDMIAGVATAGIAHGALLADYLNLPFCYVRSSAKDHGRQNQIEGEIAPNSKILVVEDLISTGGSSIEVVKKLREEGHQVDSVVSIFNYELEKAKGNFLNIQCNFFSLSNFSTIIDIAHSTKYITDEEKSILSQWNKDPQNWYSNNYNK